MSDEPSPATTGAASVPATELASPYWEAARRPLNCLVFLFPLVAAYELGALLLRPETWPEQRLVALSLIQHLAAWVGADAVWVPGVALLLMLLIWQIRSRDRWHIRSSVPLLMVLESLLLTLPLFVLGRLVQQHAGGGTGEAVDGLRVQAVLSLGAAVYEELVFRFCLVGGLLLLLRGAGRVRTGVAMPVAAILAALVFAACHTEPIGSEDFAWPRFLELVVAGGYLSTVFVLRGLGVTTGCHALFNLISVILGEH